MREILFRAKRTDTDTGEWVYGSYCPKKTGRYAGEQTVEEIKHMIIIKMTGNGYTYASVDPETVCQYTGLTDKEERKIFEGDICKYYNQEDKDGIAIIKEDYARWISGTIWIKESVTPLFYLQCSEDWEVIGNIFDNPELVKVL